MSQQRSLRAIEEGDEDPVEEAPLLNSGSSVRWEQPDSLWSSFAARTLFPCIAFVLLMALIGIVALMDNGDEDSGARASKLIVAKYGAVAAEHVDCSDIGVQVMKDGGNAVDAAVASTVCTGALNSFSSGIGGGGFMLVRNPDGKVEMIDFRERAPAMAFKGMYDKNVNASLFGGLAVAVPGELRGLELAHQRHGKLSWKRLLEPTVKLCKDGFPVTRLMEIRLKAMEPLLMKSPQFKAIFTHHGKLLKRGDTIYRPTHGRTLMAVAVNGSDAFYTGDIAKALVQDIRASGGIMTEQDFAEYKAVVREPMETWYHGYRIVTGGPPTSGPVLLNLLNVLEGFNLHLKDATSHQRIVEAMKYAFAVRGELGDPDFVPNRKSIDEIVSKVFASLLRANISSACHLEWFNRDHTYEPPHYNPRYESKGTPGTTHLCTLDSAGQAVSLMSSVNIPFGAILASSETGVFLNDQMNDFSMPNVDNVFGVPPSPHNFIQPFKRPLSSSVPVIVERDGEFEMALGGTGGTRITTAVLQVLLNTLSFHLPLDKAVDQPRFHHQLFPNQLAVESAFDTRIAADLQRIGHRLVWSPPEVSQGTVQVIRRFANSTIHAVSDGRKDALASGY